MELKNNSIVYILIAAVSLPAVISVAAYMITKDPTLRPLARTLNDEAIYNGRSAATEIIAHINWTTQREKSFTQRDLSILIHRAFRVHGVNVRVVFDQIDSADPVTIAYQVGRSTMQPTRINKAADSVNSAIAVYRMYQMHM